MQLPMILRRSLLEIFLIVVVFFGGIPFVLWLLASGRLPGVPDAPRKTVSVYYLPSAEKSPLALFLQPPTSVLEVEGPTQLLALQFTNNSSARINLEPIEVQPASCFELVETGAPVSALDPGQTHVAFYKLGVAKTGASEAPGSCSGQQHSLDIHYAFTTKTKARKHVRAKLVRSERSISTGPILITSHRELNAERFIHLLEVLAIPVLLAFGTFLIQRAQNLRAEQQKEQELKLEVWKVIFPIINRYVRKYYTPISRRMDLVHVEIEELKKALSETPSVADASSLVAALMVLRAVFEVFGREVGGFYFRTNGGEEVCAKLSNGFWKTCYGLSGNKDMFVILAKQLNSEDLILEAKIKLADFGALDATVAAFHKGFEAGLMEESVLEMLDRYLDLMMNILEFEANLLWYPEWYKTPPVIQFATRTSGAEDSSPSSLGLLPEDEEDLKPKIAKYQKELKKEFGLPKKRFGLPKKRFGLPK